MGGMRWLFTIVLIWVGFEMTASSQSAQKETAEEWQLLFDGETTAGWRGFHQKSFPTTGWVVENGCLIHRKEGGGGDIITVEKYDDFELFFEWKLGPGANSGIKYLITEERAEAVGIEYQLWDQVQEPANEDKAPGKHSTASAYDLLAPSPARMKAAGQFNQSRIIVQGKHVEHWLNERQVLVFELESPELNAAIAKSKFKGDSGFGKKIKAHILLQDHGGEVWFRQLKIRRLPEAKK
jgi:hypothetical protein